MSNKNKTSASTKLSPGTLLSTKYFLAGAGVLALAGLLIIMSTSSSSGPQGYVGPGGIGDASENNFWIDFASVGLADGATISSISDASGNGNDLSASGTAKPVFRDNVADRVNNCPVVEFDGADDIFTFANASNINTGGPYEAKTLVMTFRTGTNITDQQILFEEGGATRGLNIYLYQSEIYFGVYNNKTEEGYTAWGYTHLKTSVSTETEYIAMLSFDFANTKLEAWLNGTLVGSQSITGPIFGHGDGGGMGAINNDSYDTSGALKNPTDKRYFSGRMLEFIGYDGEVLNDAQRLILENYLSAKFGITVPNDVYAHQATHPHEVAGIWKAADGSTHEDAQGPSVLRINSADDLDVSEGIIWGHDGTDLGQGNMTQVDLSQGIKSRLNRTWEFDITGSPGTVTIMMDVSFITGGQPSDLRLLVERSGDDFLTADITPVVGTYDLATETITFTGVSLQDGDLLTLGAIETFLPVELVSFEAVSAGGEVQLNWETAVELNNDYFEIERSADGNTFTEIGREAGAGTSQTPRQYEYRDEKPMIGPSYYRLRQVDFDGAFSFSEVESVMFDPTEALRLSVFPNPCQQGKALQMTMESQHLGEVQIRVLTLTGQTLSSEFKKVGEGENNITLPTDQLSPGRYLIEVNMDEVQVSKQVVIQ